MATQAEIGGAMQRLAETMPPPRGIDPEKSFAGYCAALSSFAITDINAAITKYLSGGADPKISQKFYPRPPELATIVRSVVAERGIVTDRFQRQHQLIAEREEAARIEEVFRNRTDEQRAVVAAAYDRFRDGLSLQENNKLVEAKRERERERARIRAEFGMTDEALAAVPDRKLPKGMAPPHVDFPDHPVGAEKSTQPAEEELPW